MQESLLMGKRALVGAPLLGYNFDQKRSVGRVITTADRAIDRYTMIGEGSPLEGYAGCMRLVNTLCYMGPVNSVLPIGDGDLTVEFWVWLSTYPNNYISLFCLRTTGALVYVGFTDAGWGYRLHCIIAPNSDAQSNNKYGITQYTQQGMANAWHHYALVRKNGVVKLYVDGQPQMFAQGPSSYNYNVPSLLSHDIFAGPIEFYVGSINQPVDLYYPEVLVYDEAKYTQAFVPPKGPIAPLT